MLGSYIRVVTILRLSLFVNDDENQTFYVINH